MINIEFGDELLTQVEAIAELPLPDNTRTKNIKFDAKGTPHVMVRDEDGKLLHDYPISESKWKSAQDSIQTVNTKNEELALLQRQNKTANIIQSILLIGLGIMIILTVVIISVLL